MMILQELHSKGLIQPPSWLPNNCAYLTIMGSSAYGASTDSSDIDYYGVCIPPLDNIFPNLKGEIVGFGKQHNRFEQYQQHHVQDGDKMYDMTVYSIVKYFNLLMEGNPTVIDSIFVPLNCIVHSNQIGQLIRDNRKMFLHKGCFHKYRGYSFAQLHKMETKDPEGKRKEIRDKYGWDVKFGMHVVRLLLECEQILETGDLNMQKDKEMLKAIRRGEWTPEQVREWFTQKEKHLDNLYANSTLPYGPDEDKIKNLLLQCLEVQYGKLDRAVTIPGQHEKTLRDIAELLRNVGIS